MSIRTPPTLRKLAAKRLLRDQASAIAALEYLPAELFPYLFEMAYRGGRHPQLLKALAQAWPFTVLPLGVLMQRPPDHAPTRAAGLQAVFDALDVLLAQEVRPRRCKLRVLDLRNTGANFWDMWLGVSTETCSLRELLTMHSSGPGMEHPLAPLEVFLDLTFDERDQDEFFMHIIQWAQQREGSLHLCCKKLMTFGAPFQRVRRVLDGVRLGCIQEVEVNCTWDLSTLGAFALYLGSMSHLQEILLMGKLTADYVEEGDEEEEGEEEVQQEEEQGLMGEEELEREEQEREGEELMEWEEAEVQEEAVQEWQEAEVQEERVQELQEAEVQEEGVQEWQEAQVQEEGVQEWQEAEVQEERVQELQEAEVQEEGVQEWQEAQVQEEGVQEWQEAGVQEWEEAEVQEEGVQEWQEAEVQEWEEAEVQEWQEAEVQEGERQEQEEQQSFSEFLSQMLRLRHLRDLELCSLSFLPGRLDQVLRCLQIPLYKFCVMCCPRLTHSDLTHLFQCPNLRELRVLHLFGVDLADFSEPLRALLAAVAPTLQFLGLDKCEMADSQVEAILPVLSHCHQLRHFTIYMNNFPVATVEKLLRHTTGLRSLQREVYPVPLEGYRTQGTVNKERLALIQAELARVLRELGQPRTIQLATKRFQHRKVYAVVFS